MKALIMYMVCVGMKKGNMWFDASATGLDKLDKRTGLFTNYSDKDEFRATL